MTSNPKSVFGKQSACPSSETVLSYIGESLSVSSRQNVRIHLASCDFCNAELQLLSKHPPMAEDCMPAEISSSARLLCEELMARTRSGTRVQRAA